MRKDHRGKLSSSAGGVEGGLESSEWPYVALEGRDRSAILHLRLLNEGNGADVEAILEER